MTNSFSRPLSRGRSGWPLKNLSGASPRIAPAGGSPKRKRTAAAVALALDKAGRRPHGRFLVSRVVSGRTVPVSERALDALVQRKVSAMIAALQTVPAENQLAVARARGADFKRRELEHPDNVPLAVAAQRIGRSQRFLNAKRNEGQYYALTRDGSTRGFRYPIWQFDVDRDRLRSVLERLNGYGAGCWSIHSFLTSPHTQLGGLSPRDVIADAQAALDPLLALAQARFAADQGAG